jgi:4-hydroxythreonine-4-phosphate dehydrogenase
VQYFSDKMTMDSLAPLLITMGDVAGVGPEVILRAWPHARMHACSRPVVLGDVGQLRRQLAHFKLTGTIQPIDQLSKATPSPTVIPVLQATEVILDEVPLGKVHPLAGRAAYDFLCQAIDLTCTDQACAIVTAPLHKEGLHAAGLRYPGHTEILAERTGTDRFAMMLFVGESGDRSRRGWGVAHVTLHMALRDVFAHLSSAAVLEKIELLSAMLGRVLDRPPRLGVCGLNPHAGDGGLFGDEERTLIGPAVRTARAKGIDVTGPWPSDTLFVRAHHGEFDGVVAMYHDQGHIALKLLAGYRAVNVTLGLPIIRTSVAHGTAYDIAGQGRADPTSMLEAVDVAARLASTRKYGLDLKLCNTNPKR